MKIADLFADLHLDPSDFQGDIAKIVAEVKALDKLKANLNVDVDAAQASALLAVVRGEVAALDGEDINIDVKADTGGFRASMLEARQGVGALALAIIGLGPALVPIGAAAVIGLAPLLGALTAAGVGVLGFAGIAITAFKHIKDGADLTPEEKALKGSLDAMQASWAELYAVVAKPVLGVVAQGLDLIAKNMPTLGPIIKQAATAFGGLLTQLDQFMQSPFFKQFVSFLVAQAGPSITAFGQIFGNIFKGLMGIMMAFGPTMQSFFQILVSGTASFANWAAQLGGSNGFRSFMEYAKGVLPLVGNFIAQFSIAVGHLIQALAPIGTVILQGVTALLAAFNQLPIGVVTAMAAAIIGFVVAMKAIQIAALAYNAVLAVQTGLMAANAGAANTSGLALAAYGIKIVALQVAQLASAVATGVWTAAQWLLNAALTANPIGIVIVAIAALVAAIILAWKNSETFRTVVIAAWEAIKTAAVTVFNFIKDLITTVWNAIKTATDATWNAIKTTVTTVGAAIHAAVTAVFDAIKTYITTVFGVYKTIIETAWGVIKTIVQAGLQGIKTVVETVFNAIKAVIQTIWNGIKTVIQNEINGAKAIVQAGVGAIKTAIQGLQVIVSTVRGFFGDIVSAVRTKIGDLVSAVREIPGKITSALGNLGHLLYSAGRAIIQGLIDGIKSMFGALGSAAGAALGIIKDHLPGSPVKKGPLRVLNNGYAGKQIMRMIAGGMNSGANLPLGSMRNVAGALAGMTPAGGQFGLRAAPGAAGGGAGISVTQNIRETVDMQAAMAQIEFYATRGTAR